MTDISHAAWRLEAMECDSEERRRYVLQLAERAENPGKLMVDLLVEVLFTFDGLIDGHQDPSHIRLVISMRDELARLLQGAEDSGG